MDTKETKTFQKKKSGERQTAKKPAPDRKTPKETVADVEEALWNTLLDTPKQDQVFLSPYDTPFDRSIAESKKNKRQFSGDKAFFCGETLTTGFYKERPLCLLPWLVALVVLGAIGMLFYPVLAESKSFVSPAGASMPVSMVPPVILVPEGAARASYKMVRPTQSSGKSASSPEVYEVKKEKSPNKKSQSCKTCSKFGCGPKGMRNLSPFVRGVLGMGGWSMYPW